MVEEEDATMLREPEPLQAAAAPRRERKVASYAESDGSHASETSSDSSEYMPDDGSDQEEQ